MVTITHRLILFLVIVSCPALAGAQQSVELTRRGDQVDVLIGGRDFSSFHFGAAITKLFLYPLSSAHGTVVTRGFPMDPNIPGEDHDEPHQRAMYFAHGNIDGYDFWGEAASPRWSSHSSATFGRTAFRKLDEVRATSDSVMIVRAESDLLTIDHLSR
jgi:hypothetical protein